MKTAVCKRAIKEIYFNQIIGGNMAGSCESLPNNGFSGAGSWRTRQQRYSLKAEVCVDCKKTIFPPRDVCPHCAEDKAMIRIWDKGSIEIEDHNTNDSSTIYQAEHSNGSEI